MRGQCRGQHLQDPGKFEEYVVRKLVRGRWKQGHEHSFARAGEVEDVLRDVVVDTFEHTDPHDGEDLCRGAERDQRRKALSAQKEALRGHDEQRHHGRDDGYVQDVRRRTSRGTQHVAREST